jgi:hypothetical protein
VTVIVHSRARPRRREKAARTQMSGTIIVRLTLQSIDPDSETLRRADKAQEVWEELVRRATEKGSA